MLPGNTGEEVVNPYQHDAIKRILFTSYHLSLKTSEIRFNVDPNGERKLLG